MKCAIFSDVHSNLEALHTFRENASHAGVSKYWMLGDIVGYGANPQEVCDEIFSFSDVVIKGNHDQAISDDSLLDWFNEEAKEAIIWTRSKLNTQTIQKLVNLPYLHTETEIILTHSSPDNPKEFTYIYDWNGASKAFKAFSNKICFIGHTHLPQLFSNALNKAIYLEEGTYQLDRNDRYIISSGSIGQPRDNDTRLSFGIFDDQNYTYQLMRIPYPKEETAKKIRKAGLPRYFADRLL